MTRSSLVPAATQRVFAAALKGLSVHAGALPRALPTGVPLRIVDDTVAPVEVTRRGDLNTDEELMVLAGEDERGHFLDYYRVDDDVDGQTSHHGRIREDGSVEALENYEGQWGRPVFPDDPARTEAELQRILTNNAQVREILRAKGFL